MATTRAKRSSQKDGEASAPPTKVYWTVAEKAEIERKARKEKRSVSKYLLVAGLERPERSD